MKENLVIKVEANLAEVIEENELDIVDSIFQEFASKISIIFRETDNGYSASLTLGSLVYQFIECDKNGNSDDDEMYQPSFLDVKNLNLESFIKASLAYFEHEEGEIAEWLYSNDLTRFEEDYEDDDYEDEDYDEDDEEE